MNIILFDCHKTVKTFCPLHFTRLLQIYAWVFNHPREMGKGFRSWFCHTYEDYLVDKYPAFKGEGGALYINGAVLPDKNLVEAIQHLGALKTLSCKGELIAF